MLPLFSVQRFAVSVVSKRLTICVYASSRMGYGYNMDTIVFVLDNCFSLYFAVFFHGVVE